MQHEFTDEILMAYVDGELDAAECARLEDALEQDEALRSRLSVFEQTGRELSGLFAEPMNEPVPPHLLDLVRSARIEPPKQGLVERATAAISRVMSSVMPASPRGAMAVASVATFAIGLSLGVLMQSGGSGGPGDRVALIEVQDNQVWARAELKTALETLASNDILTTAGNGEGALTIAPLLTFRDKANRFCREYAVGGSPEAAATGIACRDVAGQWIVEAHLAHTKPDPDSDTFLPASGEGAGSLEGLLAVMISGEPLSMEDEEASIRNSWN